MEWLPSDQAYIVTCAGKLFEELCMYLQMVCFGHLFFFYFQYVIFIT